MSVFQTCDHNRVTFTRDPSVLQVAGVKGWVIKALSDDANLYDGRYARIVGWADELTGGWKIGYRLKRDAKAAMREALNLGILHNV